MTKPLSDPIGPIPTHSLILFLLQVGLLLLLATCFGRLASRVGLPAVVGELCVGVVLGPSLLAHLAPGLSSWLFPHDVEQVHLLDAVGQIGVLLLVGLTGIYMDVGLIRRRWPRAFGVSLGGLLVPLGLGIGIGFLVPRMLVPDGADAAVFALFLGVAMCVSAIPVIAKTLADMGLLHRNVGQLILIAGTLDDTVGWLLLSIVSAMATGTASGITVLVSLSYLAVALLFSVTVGRLIVRRSCAAAARSAGSGPTIASTIILILLASAGTSALGLEAVFGAFVCGLLVASVGKIDRTKLAPLRTVVFSIFAPIFFATAGLRMDLTVLIRPDVLLTGIAVLLVAIVGKFLGAYCGARLSGLGNWEALALGAGLNARGVIEVIVAMVGLRLGILSVEMYTIVILVAIVTSLLAPPILRIAMRRVEQTAEEDLREHAHQSWAIDDSRDMGRQTDREPPRNRRDRSVRMSAQRLIHSTSLKSAVLARRMMSIARDRWAYRPVRSDNSDP